MWEGQAGSTCYQFGARCHQYNFFPAHVEHFGRKGTRPPLSVLRPVLILINFSKLRQFVTRHLHQDQLEITSCDALPTMYDIDEEPIFTYAKYLEPLTIMRADIDELRDEIGCQIFQTWNVRVPVPSINLHIEDLQSNSISLQGRDRVHKVLCSFRPGWFREQVQPSISTIIFDGPYQAYLLRLECTGTFSNP